MSIDIFKIWPKGGYVPLISISRTKIRFLTDSQSHSRGNEKTILTKI